jgi:hypothetical protein
LILEDGPEPLDFSLPSNLRDPAQVKEALVRATCWKGCTPGDIHQEWAESKARRQKTQLEMSKYIETRQGVYSLGKHHAWRKRSEEGRSSAAERPPHGARPSKCSYYCFYKYIHIHQEEVTNQSVLLIPKEAESLRLVFNGE